MIYDTFSWGYVFSCSVIFMHLFVMGSNRDLGIKFTINQEINN